jgi:hypothetical protein
MPTITQPLDQVAKINNIISNSKKLCACKNCTNIGTTILEVKYIQKAGHFCDSCAKDLLQSELVLNKNMKKRDE